MDKPRVIPAIAIINGVIDRGLEIPRIGNNTHKKSPRNIKNARLTPTERNIMSILLHFSPRALRITSPGTKSR
jgi:hypothetical protein